jgi:sodium/potassium-transporting ATPase subunit alpha
LFTPFSIVLWIGAILCFLATAFGDDPANLYVGISLCVVVSLTAILTFYQTMKSQAILESFKDFIPPTTIVIRDGV